MQRTLDEIKSTHAVFMVEARKSEAGNKAAGVRARRAAM